MEHRIHQIKRDRYAQWKAVCTCGWQSTPEDTAQEADNEGTHHIAERNPDQLKLEKNDNG